MIPVLSQGKLYIDITGEDVAFDGIFHPLPISAHSLIIRNFIEQYIHIILQILFSYEEGYQGANQIFRHKRRGTVEWTSLNYRGDGDLD